HFLLVVLLFLSPLQSVNDKSQAVLNQDVSWFDCQASGSLINNLSDRIYDIEQGVGSKLGECIQNASGFISGILIAYIIDWTVALVASASLPLIAFAFSCFGILHKHFSQKEKEAYSRASSICGETISAIRTVFAFGGEEKEHKRYTNELKMAEKMGIRKAVAFGGILGITQPDISRYSIYSRWAHRGGCFEVCVPALVFWFGIKRIVEEQTDAGNLVIRIVFINIILGSILLGAAASRIPYIMSAMMSAEEICGTIERKPLIDKNAKGVILKNFSGEISFENVSFTYPARPDVKVLENFSLHLQPGTTVALVGPSGSGKSTVVQLLQRFYDTDGRKGVGKFYVYISTPGNDRCVVWAQAGSGKSTVVSRMLQAMSTIRDEGKVLVQGTDVRELDLQHFRQQLGCVQQEPVLFEGTVLENIRLGDMKVSDDEILEAAKLANAHQFIIELPDGYNTAVGEGGAGLSGGQKQRIAIARALVRNPSLLLLDEATSALDTKSERMVQMALNRASAGRTVLVVAHRLTTIRHADQIVEASDDSMNDLEEQETEGLNKELIELKSGNIPNTDDAHSIVGSLYSVSTSDLGTKSKVTNSLKRLKNSTAMRLIRLNRPELPFLLAGCLCSTLSGACQPIFGILYSEVYAIFQMDKSQMQDRVNVISAAMVGVGVARLLLGFGQGYFFGVSGEKLIRRMRSTVFKSILRQEVGWFDRSENQAGALTALLATEATKLSQITGTRLGSLCEVIMLIVISLSVSFVFSWQLTLLALAFFPFLAIGTYLQHRVFGQSNNENGDNTSVRIAQEVFRAERTVTSFSLEKHFCRRFEWSVSEYMRSQLKNSITFGILYAFAMVIPTLLFCALFALGTHLIETEVIDMTALFRVFLVFSMSSQGIGHAVSASPDASAAIISARRMLFIMDRIPKIQTNVGDVPKSSLKGHIEFKNVHFRYPTRPDVRVLKNFSHTISPGQSVAIVGQSGCGKSTLIQLLLRFYDPSNQKLDQVGIFFDGMNLRNLAPSWIRHQIGLVSQEPVLFNVSISDNIAYGDNTRVLSMDEIMEAARLANIHEFIASLPNGYDTLAGEGGSQLSGGQKQRIAIARALLRKPALLLLDEATSSLDSENERLVQSALDAARASRTAIVIAHRLTTVENSDMIVVIQDGKKIEEGKPSELLEARGAFYALHHVQKENQ
ncbi:Multidrug resistance protein 1, partial [Fasciola gigantica]